MTLGVRRLIAAVIAAGAVWLLVVNVPAAAASFRARRAFLSACDSNFPVSAKAGTWVRLKGCGTNLIFASFLTDAKGKRVRRLVPLWWIDAEARKAIQPSHSVRTIPVTPSNIVLALPMDPDDDEDTGFRLDRRAGLYPDGLDPVVETMGVIAGKTGTPAYLVKQVPGRESGIADPAVVIDLRTPPDLSSAAWSSVIGLALLAFAGLLSARELPEMPALPAFARPPIRTRPRESAWSYSSSPLPSPAASFESSSSSSEVKWGRVLVFTLVGFAVLFRGVQWYFDPARELGVLDGASVGPAATVDDSSAGAAAAATAAAYAPSPAAAALPPPTSEELAMLTSVDAANQMKAIELMNARSVTPELVAAVDLALQNPASPTHAERLICLQTRFDTPDSLERLIARVPSDRKKFGWSLSVDLACTVNALVRRVDESPERIRDTLIPAALAANFSTRQNVLATFRKREWTELPAGLVVEASAAGTYRQRAVAAAMALGAARLNPDLVAAAALDAESSSAVSQELARDTSDGAARLVARVWTEGSADRDFERLAIAREDRLHDVSTGLLEIVLDANRAETHRRGAAERLGMLREVGPIPPLRNLSASLADGDFKASVDRTIAALDVHRAKGLIPKMRALF